MFPYVNTGCEIMEENVGEVVKSADRTLDLIELLASWGREMSHTEIAESLGIPKSSLSKLLRNLTVREYVRFVPETKGYRLGDAILKLARQSNQLRSLVECAQPVLEEITAQTMESCALNQLRGDKVEVVATVTSPQILVSHLRLGDLAPLYAVSGGKCILAFMPDSMRQEYLSNVKLEKFTPRTTTSKRALAVELDEVRRTGAATSVEEYTVGIVGVGVAILSAAGFPLGALNVAIPTVRYGPSVHSKAVAILQSSAERIRRQFSSS